MKAQGASLEHLYRLFYSMPPSIQREALAVTADALGLNPEPTGLEPAPDRSFHHMFWDISITELQVHLARFIAATQSNPNELVRHLIDRLELYFRTNSGPELTIEYKLYLEDMITQLHKEQAKPYVQRVSLLDDQGITVLVGKLQSSLDLIDSRERAVVEVLHAISRTRLAITHD